MLWSGSTKDRAKGAHEHTLVINRHRMIIDGA